MPDRKEAGVGESGNRRGGNNSCRSKPSAARGSGSIGSGGSSSSRGRNGLFGGRVRRGLLRAVVMLTAVASSQGEPSYTSEITVVRDGLFSILWCLPSSEQCSPKLTLNRCPQTGTGIRPGVVHRALASGVSLTSRVVKSRHEHCTHACVRPVFVARDEIVRVAPVLSCFSTFVFYFSFNFSMPTPLRKKDPTDHNNLAKRSNSSTASSSAARARSCLLRLFSRSDNNMSSTQRKLRVDTAHAQQCTRA